MRPVTIVGRSQGNDKVAVCVPFTARSLTHFKPCSLCTPTQTNGDIVSTSTHGRPRKVPHPSTIGTTRCIDRVIHNSSVGGGGRVVISRRAWGISALVRDVLRPTTGGSGGGKDGEGTEEEEDREGESGSGAKHRHWMRVCGWVQLRSWVELGELGRWGPKPTERRSFITWATKSHPFFRAAIFSNKKLRMAPGPLGKIYWGASCCLNVFRFWE